MIIEQEEKYDSDESVEDEPVPQNVSRIWIAKVKTEWSSNPLPSAQTTSRIILRQRGGPSANSNLFTPDELFKSIMRPKSCDIILPETNRKEKRVCDAFNIDLINRFPLAFDGHHQKHSSSKLKLSCSHLLVFLLLLVYKDKTKRIWTICEKVMLYHLYVQLLYMSCDGSKRFRCIRFDHRLIISRLETDGFVFFSSRFTDSISLSKSQFLSALVAP